jgi:hypothetical protein
MIQGDKRNGHGLALSNTKRKCDGVDLEIHFIKGLEQKESVQFWIIIGSCKSGVLIH